MAIVIHPHALERMEERGATSEEVLKTIISGDMSSTKFGRRRYERTFSFKDFWRGLFYEHKHIEVYCAAEGSDMIVITVVVKYF